MTSLRVGVSGAGHIATSRHLPAYSQYDRAELVALFEPDTQRARTACDAYGLESATSFADLCDRVDLVSLCTPPAIHSEQAVAALDRGTSVLTEKPMALSVDEADRMVGAADRSDGTLSVVHNFLFMRSVKRALDLVARGEIGSVVRTQAVLMRTGGDEAQYVAEAEGTGNHELRFWNMAPHVLYLTRAFVGSMELRDADATPHETRPGYRSLRARFDGTGGAVGELSFVWDAPLSEWWLLVSGTEGYLAVDLYRDILVRIDAEEDRSPIRVMRVLLESAGQATVGGVVAGVRYLRDRFVDGYRIPDAGFSEQIHGVVDSVLDGREPPVTGADGRAVVRDVADVAEAAGIAARPVGSNEKVSRPATSD